MRSTEPNYKPPLGAWLDLEHPLSRGLVARWLINEGAGDVFGSVAGLRAVNNGAVWRPRTVGGLAVQFDGSSAFMQVAHSRIMAPATGLTLAVRLRRGDTGRRQIVLGKGDGNGPSDTQYWIEFTSSDQLAFHCSDGSTENRFVSSLILSDTSNLHTIVCTWDGATQRVAGWRGKQHNGYSFGFGWARGTNLFVWSPGRSQRVVLQWRPLRFLPLQQGAGPGVRA
jgi:hypothetical protein